jgi:hypothetical protein
MRVIKLAVERLSERDLPATWNGNALDGLWETAGNWDGNQVPASGEDVYIPETSANSITSTGNKTVGKLTIEYGWHFPWLSKGSITVNGDGDVADGAINLTAGSTFTIKGTFVAGNVAFNMGIAFPYVSTPIPTLKIDNGGILDLRSSLVGPVSSALNLDIQPGGKLQFYATGSQFTVTDTGVSLVNKGEILSKNDGVFGTGSPSSGPILDNQGRIQVGETAPLAGSGKNFTINVPVNSSTTESKVLVRAGNLFCKGYFPVPYATMSLHTKGLVELFGGASLSCYNPWRHEGDARIRYAGDGGGRVALLFGNFYGYGSGSLEFEGSDMSLSQSGIASFTDFTVKHWADEIPESYGSSNWMASGHTLNGTGNTLKLVVSNRPTPAPPAGQNRWDLHTLIVGGGGTITGTFATLDFTTGYTASQSASVIKAVTN